MPLPPRLKKHRAFTEFLLEQTDDLILDLPGAGHVPDLQQITAAASLVRNPLAPP